MEIRKAEFDEAEMVAELSLQLWENHTTEELTGEFEAVIGSDSSVVYLAMEGNTPKGFAYCGLRNDYVEGTSSSPVGYLEGIYVAADVRKAGVAKMLLTACEKWANERGCKEFASDCALTNDTSLNFHMHMGFTEANRIICFTKTISD